MTLCAGDRLGHFEVIGLLGMGGMGEVYHARDLKLGREVAVKVLPGRVAQDQNLLQRFDREARALAALNHPHIAALYSVEIGAASPFLVMELVGGQTLQERLRPGPPPLEETLRIFAQIAEALETAHERGIIHRDLKPANVKIADDDRVKILDFGLAKAIEVKGDATSGGTLALEPDSGLTAEGAILGTVIYMSPEQARGRPVDKRTDIWAFGCMLFEALAGAPPFRGETATDTIAYILEREPDWNLLPGDTPARIRELLWRCLQKDPKRRLRDIGEAWFGLQEHQSSSVTAPLTPPPTSARSFRPLHLAVTFLLAALLGGLAVAGFLSRGVASGEGSDSGVRLSANRPGEGSPRVRRFTVEMVAPLTNSAVIPFFALSPDGSRIAYTLDAEGSSGLFVRSLDRFEARFFPGAENSYAPFFSPDGNWIGLLRNQNNALQLLKVPAEGGPVVQVASAPYGPQAGQDWGEEDLIVVNPTLQSSIHAVRSSGGTLEPLLPLDVANRERMQLYPQMLPGGKTLLFTSVSSDPEGKAAGAIEVFHLETGERKKVLSGAAFGRYVPSGHLLYVPLTRDETPRHVAGAAFDLAKLEVVGKTGTPVLSDVFIHPISFLAQFDVADDGTLAYLPRVSHETEVVWIDRQGQVEPAGLPRRDYRNPRLSPDGRKIAVTVRDGPQQDVWYYDLARTSLSRVTLSGSAHSPLWRPDGQSLVIAAGRDRLVNLYEVDQGGSGEPRLLTRNNAFECPTSFSEDGAVMTWSTLDLENSSYNVAVGSPNLESLPLPYFDTAYWETWPAISPDGRWVAFVSNRTSANEVYIAPHPGPGPMIQVSNQGGTEPLWSDKGDELFYRQGNSMMAARVERADPPRVGVPTKLFEGAYLAAESGFSHEYDVTPDGRFLMVRPLAGDPDSDLRIQKVHVVLNWFEELKELVPPPAMGN